MASSPMCNMMLSLSDMFSFGLLIMVGSSVPSILRLIHVYFLATPWNQRRALWTSNQSSSSHQKDQPNTKNSL